MPTRQQIENTASGLSTEERWRTFLLCGVHSWQALPTTETGEHYCPNCCTLWTPEGAIKNVPTQPTTPR
jgi:hypothetical protein